jgi:hypothetical protein
VFDAFLDNTFRRLTRQNDCCHCYHAKCQSAQGLRGVGAQTLFCFFAGGDFETVALSHGVQPDLSDKSLTRRVASRPLSGSAARRVWRPLLRAACVKKKKKKKKKDGQCRN